MPDVLGSPLALADAQGTLQTQYTYEPFGTPPPLPAARRWHEVRLPAGRIQLEVYASVMGVKQFLLLYGTRGEGSVSDDQRSCLDEPF